MQVVVDGKLTQYERSGQGRTVVILPGWGDNSVSWKSWMARLSSSFDVIVLDLPGFGGTEAPSVAWGLDEYAAFVGKFIGKLDLNVYALLGHSNGGAIAIRSLASGTAQSEALVLVASAGVRGEAAGKKRALKVFTKAAKLVTKPLPKSAQRKLRGTFYDMVGSEMLVAEQMQETFKKIVAEDVQGSASTLTVPTLLVYAENDTQTPPRHGEILHSCIKASQLEIIEGSGHFIHLDKPDELLKLTEEFLR